MNINKIRRFIGLSANEKMLIIMSAFVLLVVRTALWLFPAGTVRYVLRSYGKTSLNSNSAITSKDISNAVDRVVRYIPGSYCLARAITEKVIYSKYGYDAELKLGVRKENNMLKAHAWTKLNDKDVIQDGVNVNRFTEFPSLKSFLTGNK